jgi:hypothetical protein
LKLSGVMLGVKEKVGGDKVENQELGAELLQGKKSQQSSKENVSPNTRSWQLGCDRSPAVLSLMSGFPTIKA